jgi:hypothetical protein
MILNSPIVSFLAIIPLAKVCIRSVAFISTFTNRILLAPQLFAYGTDELSIRVGETLAGLLNATLVCPSSFLVLTIGLQNLAFVCRVTRELFPPTSIVAVIKSLPHLAFSKHHHSVELIVAVCKTCYVHVHPLSLFVDPRAREM